VDNLDNNLSIKFYSLQQACKEIKFKFLGVSGVYKLTSKNNSSRFYIGSSDPDPRACLVSLIPPPKRGGIWGSGTQRLRGYRDTGIPGGGNNPPVFSNNLAIRMEEYNKLTKELRNPHSSSELEISKTSALDLIL
jgi:hypothetical protein